MTSQIFRFRRAGAGLAGLMVWVTWLTAAGGLSGQLTRQANSTLTLPANPPTTGYALTDAFPGMTFSAPIAVATPPGETNRLFVVERAGRIQIVSNLTGTPTKTLFFDITGRVTQSGECGLLGLAFHPQFATNGYFLRDVFHVRRKHAF